MMRKREGDQWERWDKGLSRSTRKFWEVVDTYVRSFDCGDGFTGIYMILKLIYCII